MVLQGVISVVSEDAELEVTADNEVAVVTTKDVTDVEAGVNIGDTLVTIGVLGGVAGLLSSVDCLFDIGATPCCAEKEIRNYIIKIYILILLNFNWLLSCTLKLYNQKICILKSPFDPYFRKTIENCHIPVKNWPFDSCYRSTDDKTILKS